MVERGKTTPAESILLIHENTRIEFDDTKKNKLFFAYLLLLRYAEKGVQVSASLTRSGNKAVYKAKPVKSTEIIETDLDHGYNILCKPL